ncbi:MAG TPA: hypothetical protein VLG40_04515 [Candidatus Saccharimonas sp.]|nr:hypothetical protein [Candidatus Saccharimonas sp.]
MLEELNRAVHNYFSEWRAFVGARPNKEFFATLVPTAVAYKTVDAADFESRLAKLRPLCDHISLTWLNERWVASMHLKNVVVGESIQVIKLMMRRPNSTDPTGLDHVDFYHANKQEILQALQADPTIKATHETNGPRCAWESVWFSGGEAKLRTDTVIDQVIGDFKEVNTKVLGQ